MKRTIAILLLLLLLPCLALGTDSVPDAVLDACESVLRVEVKVGEDTYTGSAFIIQTAHDGTLLVTNEHVVADWDEVSVWRDSKTKEKVDVLVENEQYDLAILYCGKPLDAPALQINDAPKQGMAVYAIGYPGAADTLSSTQAHAREEATITDGLVSAVRRVQAVLYGPDLPLLQTNAAINPGNSGGPLLDPSGAVVGVNTYRTWDAEGVGGAISSEQLIAFLRENDVPVPLMEKESAFWAVAPFVFGGAALLIGVVILLTVFIKRKQTRKSLALDKRMLNMPKGLTGGDLVAAMMPLLTALREEHMNGRLFLRLSPYTVRCTASGCRLDANGRAPFVLSDFSLPDAPQDMQQDLYAFSVLLKKLFEAAGCELPAALCNLLDRRDMTAQELIYALAPFNTGRVSALAGRAAAREPRRLPYWALTLIGVAIAGALIFGHVQANYTASYTAMRAMDFQAARAAMDRTRIGKYLFKQDCAYIEAGLLMDSGDYDAADAAFRAMGDFEYAPICVIEANYRKAYEQALNHDYDAAAETYASLGAYKDSAAQVTAVQFRKAYYALEQEAYSDAITQFSHLQKTDRADEAADMLRYINYLWAWDAISKGDWKKADERGAKSGDYAVSDEELQLAITELCYAELLENYRAKHWSDVIESAELLGDYEDADWYGYLAALHKYDYCTEEDIGYLKPYLGYDDVKDIILQSGDTAWYFLLGKWTCNYGFLQFSERKDSDHLLYNLPAPNFGNSWKLKNGVMSFYYEKDPSETKQAYRFTIIDADTIEVYCFQNNKTYTLDKK